MPVRFSKLGVDCCPLNEIITAQMKFLSKEFVGKLVLIPEEE